MANTIVKITFNDQPAVNDYIRLKAHQKVSPFGEFTRGETFKALRVNPGESTIGSTINDTTSNYGVAYEADYGSSDFSVSVEDNVVTISCNTNGQFDYFNSVEISDDFATYEIISPTIFVTGLESNRYLINNEIWITISSNSGINRFNISFYNLSNQNSSYQLTVYPSPSGVSKVNLSATLKSIFDYPEDAEGYIVSGSSTKNANTIKVSISAEGSDTVDITKIFVRGGRRTNNINQTMSVGDLCRPTYKLPIWEGYDTASYYLHENGNIRKLLLVNVPEDQKDYRRKKGCNEVYLKFVNQQGGYSNWLFESHSITESNTPKGSFVRNLKVDDLGNESDSKLKIYSKVPEYYKELINDLIVSPEVYAVIGDEYVRVLISKNSFESNNIKRSYSVNLNIDFEHRFNPSLLWSN